MIALTCIKARCRAHAIHAGRQGCEMHKIAKSPIALAGILLIASGASAPAAEPVGPKLTPKLRDALRQEMAQVLLASQDIVARW
jgi:hypothetical protein